MNETMVTVVGNVATKPVFRETQNGPVVRFRLAVTSRFFDRAAQGWKDGHTNFFTVWAWRSLAANVASSVSVGEPLLVRGRLKVRSEERGGQSWTSADIEAYAVGHDLARGTSAFRRTSRASADPLMERQGAAERGESAAQLSPDEPQFELPAPAPVPAAAREPEPAT
ncbi:single-stranded DNA-binding protein [Streptomyces luteolus]|uniref:Single-stranded DNA-binding protein n=1 Tax=Streptomyces luteolus TaxID=3043615 RepID=A0ABT6T4B0_9ACTN|nr:single-stranded DNA-binding protein [Streptomyces sp. B-S-A12]MDI3421884.1 single-stranded DNA-binding protein [Streptomyces sp. B-S-A12]